MARPTTKRTPKPRAPKPPLSFPFLFFGADAHDWFEHADMNLYIVCFDGTLDAEKRFAVGLEVFVQPHIHFNDRPWMWGDLDGNTWAFAYTVPAIGEGIADAFRDIHAAVPIRELIFGDIREEARDRWTAWSRKQKTASKRVPHLDPQINASMIHFYARREIVQVGGIVDPAFEQRRQRR